MKTLPRRALYAITSEALCRAPERLPAAVTAALRGGASLLQYRDKWNPPEQRLMIAHTLRDLCREHGARFLVNDDVALAARVQADGVHLGKTDAPLAQARQTLGADALIGVTCHADVDRAVQLAAEGASYVAFGRFFPSRTKPDAPAAALAVLTEARKRLQIPLCAIGGITPALAPQVLDAGADWIAAVEGVFGPDDIKQAAAAYCQQF